MTGAQRMRRIIAEEVAAKLRVSAHPTADYPKGKPRKDMTPQERMLAAAEIHEKIARS